MWVSSAGKSCQRVLKRNRSMSQRGMKQTIEAKRGAKGLDTVGCAKKNSATTPPRHRWSPVGAEADSPWQRPGNPPPENTALKGRDSPMLSASPAKFRLFEAGYGAVAPRAGALGFHLAPLRGSIPISSGLSLTLTTLACTLGSSE
jgi:hypothetical protein